LTFPKSSFSPSFIVTEETQQHDRKYETKERKELEKLNTKQNWKYYNKKVFIISRIRSLLCHNESIFSTNVGVFQNYKKKKTVRVKIEKFSCKFAKFEIFGLMSYSILLN